MGFIDYHGAKIFDSEPPVDADAAVAWQANARLLGDLNAGGNSSVAATPNTLVLRDNSGSTQLSGLLINLDTPDGTGAILQVGGTTSFQNAVYFGGNDLLQVGTIDFPNNGFGATEPFMQAVRTSDNFVFYAVSPIGTVTAYGGLQTDSPIINYDRTGPYITLSGGSTGSILYRNQQVTQIPITIDALNGQTANLQSWKVNGAEVASINSDGSAVFNGNIGLPSSFSIGTGALANGTHTIAVGTGASTSDALSGRDQSISIGFHAAATGFGIAIGGGSYGGEMGTSIGQSSNSGVAGVAIGQSANNSSGAGVAIGQGTTSGFTGIAIGYQASSAGGTAVGRVATATGTGTAIGFGATAGDNEIGFSAGGLPNLIKYSEGALTIAGADGTGYGNILANGASFGGNVIIGIGGVSYNKTITFPGSDWTTHNIGPTSNGDFVYTATSGAGAVNKYKHVFRTYNADGTLFNDTLSVNYDGATFNGTVQVNGAVYSDNYNGYSGNDISSTVPAGKYWRYVLADNLANFRIVNSSDVSQLSVTNGTVAIPYNAQITLKDSNHYLGYDGVAVDGPALRGWDAVCLGTHGKPYGLIVNNTQVTTSSLVLAAGQAGDAYGFTVQNQFGNVFTVDSFGNMTVNGVSGFNSAVVFNSSVNSNSISLQNGDDSTGFSGKVQLTFGYNGTTQYPHFVRTRHNANQHSGNAIDFYTGDGTQNGVFGTNSILGLTIENGSISTGAATLNGSVLVNRTSDDGSGAKLQVNGDINTPNTVSASQFNIVGGMYSGFTGSGAFTNFTIVGGIIVAAS